MHGYISDKYLGGEDNIKIDSKTIQRYSEKDIVIDREKVIEIDSEKDTQRQIARQYRDRQLDNIEIDSVKEIYVEIDSEKEIQRQIVY